MTQSSGIDLTKCKQGSGHTEVTNLNIQNVFALIYDTSIIYIYFWGPGNAASDGDQPTQEIDKSTASYV